ncbi:hypothetical protein NADFUDRAFT_53349 [Nadsonia fulvescens var. elongata DSM 6958]|uniref:Glutaredoxin-like protein n=1 Tax=Nadsonia fulvescens var. elongata DSM 6958 TaxID=857566 RepID=A0A1E3PER0_9ASCO|nr:hypothetical protein NADFUDRAFT_53349 [Nadsonia fulvescens var. elongata DSM 6958]
MRLSFACFSPANITLFVRPNCKLCTDAKDVLRTSWDKTKFDYTEVDITRKEHQKWFDIYAFDTPVVHIFPNASTQKPIKLMHRIKEHQILDIINKE